MKILKKIAQVVRPTESLHAIHIGDYSFTYRAPGGQMKTFVVEGMTSQAEANTRAVLKMDQLIENGEALRSSLRRA